MKFGLKGVAAEDELARFGLRGVAAGSGIRRRHEGPWPRWRTGEGEVARTLPEHPNNLKTSHATIHDMRAHLAASIPRFGPIGHSPRLADHVSAAHEPHRLLVCTWQRVVGPPCRFGSIVGQKAGDSAYIQMRGGASNEDVPHTHAPLSS